MDGNYWNTYILYYTIFRVNWVVAVVIIQKKKFKKWKKKYTLHQLLEQWTRAEVLARLGLLGGEGFIDHYNIMLKKEDEIRELLYGTSDLVQLGNLWKLPIRKNKKKRSMTHGKREGMDHYEEQT